MFLGEQRGFLVQEKVIPLVRNEAGQVAVEFILTLAFGLGVSFLFISLTFNYTVGHAVHYVNYMVSRSFLVYDISNESVESNIRSAVTQAQRVYESYRLDRFNVPNDALTIYAPGSSGNAENALFVGSTLKYSGNLSLFRNLADIEALNFYSESFLGKEPLRSECHQRICEGMGMQNCNDDLLITMYDNGC